MANHPGIEKLLAELRLMDIYLDSIEDRVSLRRGSITSLNLDNSSFSNFSHFPISLSKMSSLRQLSLRHNKLYSITSDLVSLTNLLTLDLSDNCLSDLSVLAKFPNLKHLRLKNNCIDDLSPLSSLNLHSLNVSENNIVDLTPITAMDSLQYLSVASNLVSEIPASISRLVNLRYLNLRSNQIDELPSTVLHLPRLEKLNVYNNNLSTINTSSIPSDLTVFADNRITQRHDRIRVLRPQIIDYRYSRKHPPQFGISRKGIPFVSVMIYGDDFVGKQSFADLYVRNYLIPEKSLSVIQNRYLSWDHYIIERKSMIFQLWYPYSQESYDPTYNTSVLNGFYYTGAVILMFDLSDLSTFNTVLHSIKQIFEIRVDTCPILIVGNKADLCDVNSRKILHIRDYIDKIARTLDIDLPYLEVSVKENQNIDTILDKLYNIITT